MSLKEVFLLTTVGLTFLASCSFFEKSEHEVLSEIYSDVIEYEFSYGSNGNFDYCTDKALAIDSKTQMDPFIGIDYEWEIVNETFIGLEQETWSDFLEINKTPIPFPDNLDLDCEYSLMGPRESTLASSIENCTGIYSLSQIGFNSRKDQALVFLTFSCWDYSYGNLYFVELTDGHWKVTNRMEVFIT